MAFKDRLREACDASGKTRRELCQALGRVGESAIWDYFSGRAKPSISTIAILANETDTSIDWLAGLSNSKEITNRLDFANHDEYAPQFKDRLKIARKNAGITQLDVANHVGVKDDSGYRPYEAGKRTPNIHLAARMADRLNVSLDWLCGLSGDTLIHDRIPLDIENEE